MGAIIKKKREARRPSARGSALRFSPYKILFHFTALLLESIILL